MQEYQKFASQIREATSLTFSEAVIGSLPLPELMQHMSQEAIRYATSPLTILLIKRSEPEILCWKIPSKSLGCYLIQLSNQTLDPHWKGSSEGRRWQSFELLKDRIIQVCSFSLSKKLSLFAIDSTPAHSTPSAVENGALQQTALDTNELVPADSPREGREMDVDTAPPT